MEIKSSFRDPSGRVFIADGEVFRTVSAGYKDNYDFLMFCGLYERLTEKGHLVKHEEVGLESGSGFLNDYVGNSYKLLKPSIIPFISYPYEWCFEQLKDAALLTIEIQLEALKFGMTLKDATAYNVQFVGSSPVFIDTLSFEIYEAGKPWAAYRQFCKHFLAPLALMTYTDKRLYGLFKEYIDGVPLDLASKLLPLVTKFKPGLYMHIHLHSKVQNKFENKDSGNSNNKRYFLKKQSLINLIENLRSTVKNLKNKKTGTEWGEYYNFTNYSDSSFESKKALVEKFLDTVRPSILWDMGANNGLFSKLASSKGAYTVAFDIDFNAVEACYRREKNEEGKSLLPLIMDLTNPSGGIGWGCEERDSIVSRAGADVVMALALIHHIAISNNVPFDMIADFLAKLGEFLIIEWVPKEDSQTQIILDGRDDIFENYNEECFERAFAERFSIIEKKKIDGTKRTLYLMRQN